MKTIYTVLFLIALKSLSAQVSLIAQNSSWKYLDNGSDQGNLWYQPAFNDNLWATGNAELGYGDGDEATVVSYGNNSNNKHITTYFRKSFSVSNPSQFSYLSLGLVRDDGAVVYINGVEVARTNMPNGPIYYNTPASGTVAWPNEDDWNNFQVSAALLQSGNNVIAVEIHQDSPSSSDISFNLRLTGETTPLNVSLLRQPYLQMATPNSVIIRWRTNVPCDSKVQFGLSPGLLNQTAFSYGFKTDHEILITGLNPETKYYYTVGNNNTVLASAATNQYFKTHPLHGKENKYRFWVIGDAGTGNNNQRAVRDAFLNYNNNQHIDGWLMLGDNAYDSGYDSEYQVGVFQDMYEDILRNTVLWPTPGNHDYNHNIPFSPPPAYFDIFNLPTNAQAGGYPSGTEKYYSWNIGNVHFISLDSYDSPRSVSGAMAQWLQADLAANTLPWVIAYWHHPPYTKGSHNSDNPLLYDFELVDMRENIVPILESGGVDLVLCGHSHCYERSFLLDGHYGYSSSLQPSMILNNTSGNYPVVCPYSKYTEITKANKGAVYAVVGCSGKLSGTSSGWPHPIMHTSTNTDLGSLILEIEKNRLDAKFLTAGGQVLDAFTIMKNIGKNSLIQACPGDQLVLKPSWVGAVEWFPGGSTNDSLLITASVNSVIIAKDPINCIRDTFNIEILSSPPCSLNNINPSQNYISEIQVNVFPSIATSGTEIILNCLSLKNSLGIINVTDINGRNIFSIQKQFTTGNNIVYLPTQNLSAGMYIVSVEQEQLKSSTKFHITN